MRILQFEGISFLSKRIRWMTWNKTTHTAYEFDDGHVIEAWSGDGFNCVRLVDNLHTQHTPGTICKAYTIPGVSQMQQELIQTYLLSQLDMPYSTRGCLRFVTRRDPQPYDPQTFCIADYNPENWFCSCLIFSAFARGNINLLERVPPWRVGPGLINYAPRLKLDETITVKPEEYAAIQELHREQYLNNEQDPFLQMFI